MIFKNYFKLSSPKDLFLKDQLSFVKELIKASVINFPFQNITTFGAFLPCDRKVPTYKELIASNVRGEGGLCTSLNLNLQLQLETYGFQTEVLHGLFRRTGIPSHYLITVKIPGNAVKDSGLKPMDPRPDRKYLIDVGCGIPLHEPIPLDSLPYYGVAAGVRFRYEQLDDNTIQRVNEGGDAIVGKKSSDFVSPQDYSIYLEPRKYSDFLPALDEVYLNHNSGYLHRGLYSARYLEITEDDFEMVCALGTDLIFITKETRNVQKFGSYEKLKPSLLKYFPMIDPHFINLTVKHFSIPFEEALKMTSSTMK